PETAAAKAKTVLDLETLIAKASADRVSMRDPNKRYHIMRRDELGSLAGFPWDAFFAGIGAPSFDTLNVSNPDFFKQLAQTIPTDPGPWKAYFAYHLLRATADQLPAAFENESFDFWQRYLTGAKEPRPRSARCTVAVDRNLGDLLGQKYIEVAFG